MYYSRHSGCKWENIFLMIAIAIMVLSCSTDGDGSDGNVTFIYHDNTVSSVWVSGDFNAWAATVEDGAYEMEFDGSDTWSVIVSLTTGTYQYKFILDGVTWIHDPENPDMVDDGYGGFNSVLEVP